MAPFCFICFIVFAFFNGRVQSAQWSSTSLPEGQILYACAGDIVTLHWQYALTSGEVLDDIQWLYDGQSQELVAMSSRGNFLTTPTFSQRVSRVDNAGLSLSRVMVPDSGNYSVEVSFNAQGGASRSVLRRTAVLQVSDRLMTTDGVLHVTLLRDPIYNTVSKQWVLQLQCGNFIFKDNPPYEVEWTTPSGSVHNSTSFSNGNFYLSIPMPIESGTYTCRIPAHLSARACLHGNGTSEGRTSVTVESSETRLLLLEKENSDLKATVADLASRLIALQTSHNQQNQDVQRLNNQMNQTQMRLGKIEDAEQNKVAFHATGLSVPTKTAGATLMFSNVIYNQGNAYNSSTGYFTAPHPGLYFFAAKTGVDTENGNEWHYLMVDNSIIDQAYTLNRVGDGVPVQSPVLGVVHLTQGQRVSVRCNIIYGSLFLLTSSFTGFLLSRDP